MLISLLIMEEKSSATKLSINSSRLISLVESPDSERLIVLISSSTIQIDQSLNGDFYLYQQGLQNH